MAPSGFAILASVALAVIGALPFFLLPMDGELPFYIATAVGLFVAASVIWAGWRYPKNKFYKTFMEIYVLVGSGVVAYTSSIILMMLKNNSSLKLEWILFGMMTGLVIASLVHDYLVDYKFQLGKTIAMYLAGLIGGWALRCWNVYGEALLFLIPAHAVLIATIVSCLHEVAC